MWFTYKSGLVIASGGGPEVVLKSSPVPSEVNSKMQTDPNEDQNNLQDFEATMGE